MRIFPEKSWEAVERLARKMHKSIIETASGIVEIANAIMGKAIRLMSIERGFDPRDFALFSFGGAGGMHAVDCAENLKISTVIIPKNAGVLSAFGLLLADSIKDYSESVLSTVDDISMGELDDRFEAMKHSGLEDMRADGFEDAEIMVFPSMDLRYFGQSFEINIPYGEEREGGSSFVEDFHRTHRRVYSYHHEGTPVEIVNMRLKVVGRGSRVALECFPPESRKAENALTGVRKLHYRGGTYEAGVYDRILLAVCNRVEGPAVVGDTESTTFVPPGFAFDVDPYLNLIKRRKG